MARTPEPPAELNRAVGYSGLNRLSGFVLEEWQPELQGSRGRRTIREMVDSDPTIGAILFAIQMLIRGVDWSVKPHESLADDDDGRAEFIQSALDDMLVPWPDRLSEILSFLQWGWALHEQVYKRRTADTSKYGDGRIGWFDWPMRGQESLLKWIFDDQGTVIAMVQLGPPTWREVTVPMSKSLLFRTSVAKGNPEGKSVLRSAYLPWYFLKKIRIFEAIGIERDLAGLPYLRIPGSILEAASSPNPTPEDKAALDAYTKLVTSIKRDENEGVILPSDVDPESKLPMYTFELLRSAGPRQFDTNEVIARYERQIAQTVLADFIQLGHGQTGSRALAQSKTELFTAALRAWMHPICAEVNNVAIPRLLRLNGMSTDAPPQLVHGDIEREDLDSLGAYLLRMSQAGFELDTRYDSNLTKDLLQKARMPDPPAERPDVLNEPTVTYDQTVAEAETTDQADTAAPKPGNKRKPKRVAAATTTAATAKES